VADVFYPSPQAAVCGVCGKFAWLCPHDWSERTSIVEWEAFARGVPWKPSAKATTAPSESTQVSTAALEDSEKFPVTTAPVVVPEPMRVRIRLDDAPPAPPRRHYLCGCSILFNDPWIWKIRGFPGSHQQGCLYAENERFVASLRKPQVVEAPQAAIERPAPKTQKRVIESLTLELPK